MTTLQNKKIEAQRWYSLKKIAEKQVFPWLGSDFRTYQRFIDTERKKNNHLKGMTTGKGRSKRYKFKGENILSFLTLVESGKVTI